MDKKKYFFQEIPDTYLKKWQKTVDLMAQVFEVPASLIMRVHPEEIEVLLSSRSEENPYKQAEMAALGTGLYCEKVIQEKSQLIVPNALQDPEWENNPDVSLNMISYLGLPLVWPDGFIFGTICVLDSKTREYSKSYQDLLWQFKGMIEADLTLLTQRKELESWHHKLENLVKEKTESLNKEISEHKQTVSELRKANDIQAKIFSTSHLSIAYMDSDFNFIRVNSRYAQAGAKSVDFFVGKNHFDLYPDDENRSLFEQVVKTGQPYTVYAKPFYYPDSPEKVTYWNWTLDVGKDEQGKVEGLLLTLQDVTDTKKAELALEESQIFLEKIVENIPNMIFVKDAKELRFVRFNKAGEELLGYQRKDLLGKNDYDFFPEEEAAFFTQKDKEVLQGGNLLDIPSEPIETRFKGKRVLHTKKIPILNQKGEAEYLLGISEDITEKQLTEEALYENEELLTSMFESIQDGVSILDKDLTIRRVNNVMMNWYQEKLPLEGKKCHQCYQDIDMPCDPCPTLRCIQSGKTEVDIVAGPPGSDVEWLELRSHPLFNVEHDEITGVVEFVRNITKRMCAEKQLIVLSRAMETSTDVIIITDLNGNVTYTNKAITEIYGYCSEELLGTPFSNLGYEKTTIEKVIIPAILETGGWNGELGSKRKDATVFSSFLTSSLVSDHNKVPIGMLGIVKDLTEIKASEQKKDELEKQLRQAMKMEAIGTLAGGIAHDFNNILSAILGYSEMARVQLPAEDKIGKNLDQVIKAGYRATDLVKQILAFSRQGEENLQPIKVQLIISEVFKLLRSSLPTTIQLKESIDTDCSLVLADPTQIHQVLMNLCTNAKHAIGNDIGTLSVSLSEIQINDTDIIIDCPLLTHGRYLDLKIRDTGCGMDGLTRSKIFDPFFTTKEQGKGTGLGLAVVHGIIKQHKGEITVASEPGQGTTFHIYLPVIDIEETEAGEDVIKDIPRGGGERILFVDDETFITDMMQQLLDNLGYAVTVFTSSLKALDAYKKNPTDFDLVITDMTMPEMTGIDLTRKLLSLRPDLPVILCTGFSEAIDEATAKSFGICEYIKKPVDQHTLAKAIRNALKAP